MTVHYCQHDCNHSILIHPTCQCSFGFTQFLSLPSTPKPFIPSNTVPEQLSVTPTLLQYIKFQSVHTKAVNSFISFTEVPAYTLHGEILIPWKALQIFPLTTRPSKLLSCLLCSTDIYHHLKVQ